MDGRPPPLSGNQEAPPEPQKTLPNGEKEGTATVVDGKGGPQLIGANVAVAAGGGAMGWGTREEFGFRFPGGTHSLEEMLEGGAGAGTGSFALS